MGFITPLNNLTALTWVVWLFPTTRTTNRVILQKGDQHFIRLSGTTGNVRFFRDRTTDTDYITNSTPLASLSTWYCLAITFDSAATPTVHIYIGSLTATMVECTYGTAIDGSGALASDGLGSLVWGNNNASTIVFQGSIAIPMMFNRVLTLRELQSLQYQPRVISGCQIYQQLGYNGTSTQTDYSGNVRSGTVTGATVGSHVPLRSPWAVIGAGRSNRNASALVMKRNAIAGGIAVG